MQAMMSGRRGMELLAQPQHVRRARRLILGRVRLRKGGKRRTERQDNRKRH